KLRAIRGELANLAGISRLVADENAECIAIGEPSDQISIPFVKATDFVGNARNHAVNQRKRLVLSERNEMNFVVDKNALTLGVEEQCAVVWRESPRRNLVRRVHGVLPFNRTGKKRMLKLDRQFRG